jgi:hypothetical protein
MTRVSFRLVSVLLLLWCTPNLRADSPVASYIFPAGGQRGKTVDIRVGGLFLYKSCGFEMLGPGIKAPAQLQRTRTVWFEGPVIPQPESQQQEDYPRDMAGKIEIAADAPLGVRHWRTWTAQGATPAMRFVVGDLPEIVEEEIDGNAVPVPVQLPVTINGRIFPREDVDVWSFPARKGLSIVCEVMAARLGSPLDSRLEILDPHGKKIAENDDYFGSDSYLRFTAAEDGTYQVKIHDVNYRGGQAYVYRLTITADPHVERVFPLGGRRGSKVMATLTGQGLPSTPVQVQLPGDAADVYAYQFSFGGKQTNPVLFDVDDLLEVMKSDGTRSISAPAMCNGRIDKPGAADSWPFTTKKGETWEIELRAQRLGSPLAGVLTVKDAGGKELQKVDSTATGQGDPSLRFTAPSDGLYVVEVSERFAFRGGPEFSYRLRVDHPSTKQDFRLSVPADVVALERGGQAKLKVNAVRLGGFSEAINLVIEGLPAGVIATSAAIPAKQTSVDVTLKTDQTALIRASRLTIRGSAAIDGQPLTRVATASSQVGGRAPAMPVLRGAPEPDSILLAVTLPTAFKVVADHDMRWAPRGSVHHRRYRLERNGFDGPLEISLADRQARHLQGVTGPTFVVPPGKSEFDYPITMPPWMETGRTCRVVVQAVGMVKDRDGTEHPVSYSSARPEEQIIVVVEPGRVGVEAERGSLHVAPGKTQAVVVHVSRGALTGPAKVELLTPPHFKGIQADPLTIPADKSSGTLAIRFSPAAHGPLNMPLVIRATIIDKSEPVVAETKLDLLEAK